MAFDFNPITGQLDLVGGGSSYIDGDVQYHADLPVTVGTPAVNSAFLVRKGQGLYFLTRKPAGIWVRELNVGNLDDWKYAGTFSDLYRDANFRIINDADPSKELAFSLSGIATGTTRTITMPNANVTLPNQGTSTTDNVFFSNLETDSNVTVGGDLIIGNAVTVGINGVVFENAPSEATILTTLATASRAVSLPNASGTIALNETFAAPPAIGNTTPAAASFTTLSANNGTLTASAPALDLAQTWNNAAVTFTGMRFNATDTASASDSILADFQRNGSSFIRLARSFSTPYIYGTANNSGIGFTTTGIIATGNGGNLAICNSGNFGWTIRSDGRFAWAATTNVNTASDVELFRDAAGTLAQRNGTNPQTFRLYNTFTSATNFERLNVRWASNELIIDAEAGSAGGTLRGIKLGSASTSLLGFFGATPVVRQAAIADATDAATTQARLNDLLATMRTFGLIAT